MKPEEINIKGYIFRTEDYQEIYSLYRELFPEKPAFEIKERTQGCLISNVNSWAVGFQKEKE